MAIIDNIKGIDRLALNVAIVAVLIEFLLGALYFFTGWSIAKMAMLVAGPIGVFAVFVGVIRAWLPRDEV